MLPASTGSISSTRACSESSAALGMLSCSPAHAAFRSDPALFGRRSSSEPTRRRNARICRRVSSSCDPIGRVSSSVVSSGRVAWISISPVKGLALRQLEECELTEAGVAGDRGFFLVDENGRLVNSKGLGALQQIVPSFDSEADVLDLSFPDGTTVVGQVAVDGSLEAQFWGMEVPVRVVEGPWSEAISGFAGRSLRLVRSPGPATDRLRSGAATLLGTASLRAMDGPRAASRSTGAASG